MSACFGGLEYTHDCDEMHCWCPHARWREDHDGHHSHGWECMGCGLRSWIAPWVLGWNRK